MKSHLIKNLQKQTMFMKLLKNVFSRFIFHSNGRLHLNVLIVTVDEIVDDVQLTSE